MSITLDVKNFLKNANPATVEGSAASTAPQTSGKLDAMLQTELDVAELPKDTTNIFDEIENLLKTNKYIDNHRHQNGHGDVFALDKPPVTPIGNQFSSAIVVSSPNLEFEEFALPNCVTPEFLISEETSNYQDLDPQLFSVEDGELQPITSPFMVPGIYKKFSNALAENSSAGANEQRENVFISTKESSGRIVTASRFPDLYVFANENGELPEEYGKASQRQVLLLEELESKEDELLTPLPPLGVNFGNKIVPKQWDALSKLAYDIMKLSNRDHIVIDRNKNEIVRTNNSTSQKTIYRFLSPENFGLKPHDDQISCPSLLECRPNAPRQHVKRGRPRKRQLENSNQDSNKKSPKQRKVKKKEETKPQPAPKDSKIDQQLVLSTERTRYGRVVRKRLASQNTITSEKDPDDPPDDSMDFIQNFLADLKDNDFHCSKPISPMAFSSELQSPTETPISTPKEESQTNNSSPYRKPPPEAICPTCNKIFLGRRLQRHFAQHPDHIQTPTKDPAIPPSPNSHHLQFPQCNGNLTLFRFLVSKLQKSNLSEDQRADLFLSEINDFVTQLQLRSSRLIRNTSGLHFVSARCSRVLGIPEGQYALDMTAIENEAPPLLDPETPAPCLLNFGHLSSSALPVSTLTHTRNLDYSTLSMSLDNTLTDEAAQKLNLSAGGKLLPPSEESLLRTVDDLVHDGIQKLNESSTNLLHPPVSIAPTPGDSSIGPPVIHYDHASDNAVEAVSMKETPVVPQTPPILGLSVDFFKFNND